MIRVAVAGASGYMGAELLRTLFQHPEVTLTAVTSERMAGEPLVRAYPHLRGFTDLAFGDLDAERLAAAADAVFLALPHMESQKAVPVLRRHGVRVIDLSADYRLRDPEDYTVWYKAPHIDPEAWPRRCTGCRSSIARRSRERGSWPRPAAIRRGRCWPSRPCSRPAWRGPRGSSSTASRA